MSQTLLFAQRTIQFATAKIVVTSRCSISPRRGASTEPPSLERLAMDYELSFELRCAPWTPQAASAQPCSIIIGVGAVIAMLGVGQGAQRRSRIRFRLWDSNMLFVGSGSVTRGGMHLGWARPRSLIYNDSVAILRECPAAKSCRTGKQL